MRQKLTEPQKVRKNPQLKSEIQHPLSITDVTITNQPEDYSRPEQHYQPT